MKFLLLFVSILLVSCGGDIKTPSGDITIGTKGIEGTWDKSVSDVRHEYDRTENRVSDTLVKTNLDVVNEEHKLNDRVKDTGAKANQDTLDTLSKANMDVLDEEKRTSERLKDTAKKTNMDAVEEEHKFNQRTKDTSAKANGDFNSEKERFKDTVLGTDERQIESNDRRITDLEGRVDLIEQLNSAQDSLLALYMQQMQEGDKKNASDIFNLRTDLSAVTKRMDKAESDISVLQALTFDIGNRVSSLEARMSLSEAALAQEIQDRMAGDSDLLAQLSQEASIRAGSDLVLGAAILIEAVVRSLQVNALQTTLGAEIAQRIAGDANLAGQILAEKAARIAGDANLNALILAEKNARIAGDSALQASLNAEIAARQDAIAAEATARACADSALYSSQSTLAGRVTALETAVANSCTLTVVPGTVTNFGVEKCDSTNIFGVCTGVSTRRTMYSADLKMQCLGKPATVLQNVLFETSP